MSVVIFLSSWIIWFKNTSNFSITYHAANSFSREVFLPEGARCLSKGVTFLKILPQVCSAWVESQKSQSNTILMELQRFQKYLQKLAHHNLVRCEGNLENERSFLGRCRRVRFRSRSWYFRLQFSKLMNFNVFNRKCQKTVKHKVTFNLFVFKEVHIYFF